MELAVEDNDRMGRFVSSDSTGNYPVRFNDFWGRWTETGVHGDATKGTPEKGRILFEAAVAALVELVDELRAWPIAEAPRHAPRAGTKRNPLVVARKEPHRCLTAPQASTPPPSGGRTSWRDQPVARAPIVSWRCSAGCR